MKIAAAIARYLLGLVFLVFGLNIFIQFWPSPPIPGTAGQFIGALVACHYMYPVGVLEVVPAILLLINRYVPLALVLLAPVIVNIFLVHALMLPDGLPVASVVVILWILVAIRNRYAFAGLFLQRVPD